MTPIYLDRSCRLLAWTAFALLGAGIAGCALPGAVGYKMFGPPPIEAKYKPAQEPLLVMAENYRLTDASEPDAHSITVLVESELKDNKVAPIVDSAALVNLRDTKGDAYRGMSIPDVGKAVGAKQVLYVDIVSSKVDIQDDELLHGEMRVRVRIVDADTGKSRWPDTAEGYELAIETPYKRTQDEHARVVVKQEMLQNMSDKIAHLFYKYKPEDLTEERDDSDFGN